MLQLDRIQGLLQRLASYPAHEVIVEIVLIWVVVFAIVRFVQGTQAAGALKGLLLILAAATILSRLFGGTDSFQRLAFLYDRFVTLVAVALVVIFQPELRRALVRLAETPFFRGTPKEIGVVAEAVSEAADYLSRAKFGAIIVIERSVGIAGLVEGGVVLNAEVSAPLLQTIFFPNSALHDLAVVIKGKTIHAASVQLPLADPASMPSPTYGARHRAAIGLTRECDALVVVVSEETGRVTIAERGKFSDPLDAEQLQVQLRKRLGRGRIPRAAAQVRPTVEPPTDALPDALPDAAAERRPGEHDPAQAAENTGVEEGARR